MASTGVPLSELAPNAPDSHTVRPGDTLWGISTLFLTSPWRWPALWGMNLDQIRNPHLIYPGQVLVLERVDGMARLRMAGAPAGSEPTNTVRLSPRVRSELLDNGAIAAIPLNRCFEFRPTSRALHQQISSTIRALLFFYPFYCFPFIPTLSCFISYFNFLCDGIICLIISFGSTFI